jgi:hypothetical protein
MLSLPCENRGDRPAASDHVSSEGLCTVQVERMHEIWHAHVSLQREVCRRRPGGQPDQPVKAAVCSARPVALQDAEHSQYQVGR